MSLKHEAPLSGFHQEIGGSAGKGTHGGTGVQKPADMPSKSDCDYVVDTPSEFVNAVRRDDASVYVNSTINLTNYLRKSGGIDMGSGVAMVGGYCDPSISGRGPEIICNNLGYKVLTSCYGKAPSLWGISFRGPELEYVDPDHTADDFEDKHTTGLWCYDTKGTLKVVGCEFRGWTLGGLETGARNKNTTVDIKRSSFHHCLMEHLGYAIEHYNGQLTMDKCFFDSCRHAISGFGYPDCSWELRRSVVGPGPWSGHALDMHCLANNFSSEKALEKYEHGGKTAGGDILIENCTLMSTKDVNGSDQEAFALRGIPTGTALIESSHFWHSHQPSKRNKQGNAYRQENGSWKNFYVEDCLFGKDELAEGVGAPLSKKAPDKNMKELKIDGKGGPNVHGPYEIIVNGSVETGSNVEPNDNIEDLGDGRTKIVGDMWGGVDVFKLSKDALVESATLDTPVNIILDGEDITGAVVATGLLETIRKQEKEIAELREHIDTRLASASISFEEK